MDGEVDGVNKSSELQLGSEDHYPEMISYGPTGFMAGMHSKDSAMPATKPVSVTPTLPAIDHRLYAALKADIQARGIICPLVYDAKTRRCLDGVVRLRICEELGIRQIPKIFVGSLNQTEGDDLRIALNGLRRQLSRDQLQTMIEWSLRRAPEHSDREHARRTGADSKTVGKARERLEATEDIPQSPKRVGADGRSRPSTRKPLVFTHHAAAANEAAKAMDKLGDKAPSGVSTLRKLRWLVSQEEREAELKRAGPTVPEHFDLQCCDFRDLKCPEGIASLALLDPPWHTDKDLRQPFAETVHRILKPGGYALIYTGNAGVLGFGDVMREAGLTFRWITACVNDDEKGAIKNNGTVYACWRPVSVYQKGGHFKTPSVFHDVLKTTKREKTYHDWQQPLEEAVAFVKAFTRPGELIVDLTAGTFTVATAVALVGGRRFLGCEIRHDLVELGKRRVAEALA